MDATLLTDKNAVTASTKDTASKVTEIMNRHLLKELPVVDGKKFAGYITRQALAETVTSGDNWTKKLITGAFVDKHTHWYDLLKAFKEHPLDSIAVVDGGDFLGTITEKKLVNFAGNTYCVQTPGSIMILEIKPMDYVPSRIAKITEEKNAKILCLNVNKFKGSPFLRIHIKVNTNETQGIIRELERYGYHVVDTYREPDKYDEHLQENYDALMRYLDI